MKKIILLATFLSTPAFAQQGYTPNFKCIPGPYGCVEPSNGSMPDLRMQPMGGLSIGFAFDPMPPSSITIGNYVTLRPNGTIEYGKNYTPDVAAKAFWDAVGIERKARNCQ